MKFEQNALSRAVTASLSLGAVVAVGASGSALAQDANDQAPQTLQTVVVTGSHISRVDVETDNPVIAVSSQQIEATGALTVGGVVTQLPAIIGGKQVPLDFGGGDAQVIVGLRGLGGSRTLLLVDGQRVISSDMNAIPSEAVQRIEVLTSGAAAIYGSDAIGGVINVILKSNYQGADVSVNYGVSSRGDARRKGASFVFGQTSDKGSIVAGVGYNKFEPLRDPARKFSEHAFTLTTTPGGHIEGVIGGSSFTPHNFISVSPELAAKFGCSSGSGVVALNEGATSPTTMSDYHCFTAADRYDYSKRELLVIPQERSNAFFKGTYHLTDSIDFTATYLHNKTSSETSQAPALYGTIDVGGVLISKDSYYNPFGVDFESTGARWRTRMLPVGDRIARYGTVTDQINIGLKGYVDILGRHWQWGVGYNYGHVSQTSAFGGQPLTSLFQQGLGPSFMNGDGVVQCGTATNPIPLDSCTPFDPFVLGAPSTQKVLGASGSVGLRNRWSIERIKHADANGGLFDLPAGTVQLALGAAYRSEYENNTVGPALLIDPSTGVCGLASGCSHHLQGGYNVKDAYAELFIPILQGVPFASGLNMTLGDRYSKYSNFGSTNNWKVGVEWRPISDLLLRGTVSSVFRAPSVEDIFAVPGAGGGFISSDFCDGITVATPGCEGVPLDGSFRDSFVAQHTELQTISTGTAYGGFPLGPETGKSFDFGAVYSPNFVPGLSLTADIWRIYLKGTITQVGTQEVLNLCGEGDLRFCDLIGRIQSGPNAGQILTLLTPVANLGRIDVKGVDFSGQYQLPMFSFGQFAVNLHATYLTQYKIQTAPGAPGNTVLNGAGVFGWDGSGLGGACPFAGGGTCFFPRISGQGTLRWQLGNWNAQWTMRYLKDFDMAKPHFGQGLDHYGSYVYNDVVVGYDIVPFNTHVSLGVNNVFDKMPPLFYATRSNNANTAPESFDVLGRYYWASISVKF